MTSSGMREPFADLHGPVRAGRELRRGPARLRRDLKRVYRDDFRGCPGRGAGCRGRTRTISSRYPGVTAAQLGLRLRPALKRIRAAQAEDSAITVILPLSRVHRFTLLASSGPNAFITATCHTDVLGRRKGTLGESWQTRRD